MIIPLILWTGISQATYSGCFVPMINSGMNDKDWSANRKLSMSLYAMIPLGASEILGSLLHGRILDRHGNKAGVMWCMATLVGALVLVFVYLNIFEFGVVAFVMTFMWGLHDSALSNQANCILGFEFESKILPFAIYKFVQSFCTFIFLVIEA